ncbi:hypothetical protein LIA77_05338 [Sarocladium implicatum]|nr:hypothetical protein LIA77_05338 [Sarocladium implicatum]
MKITTFASLLAMVSGSVAEERANCHGDNCANQVTGTFGGIGIPIETRISMCNSYLLATIQPEPTTVTQTITKYTTRGPRTTKYPKIRANVANTTIVPEGIETTILPESVPTFAAEQCSSAGQFSSACACWANVTASTTTLPRSTATETTTTYRNVGCGPAATAVSKSKQFPCSRQWGMCSCLRSEKDGDVCVRVGDYGSGKHDSGPCENSKECNAKGGCDEPGMMCVYDGSCKCGKKRCYKAAADGCDYQGLPMDGFKRV